MPTVVSRGTLTDATFWGSWDRPGGLRFGTERWMDYATIYRTQPNVYALVNFVARNIAQLGIHVFRRLDENDRERLRNHQLAQTLDRPNPWTTRHRLIYSTIVDKKVFGDSYWLKVPVDQKVGLVRVPPQTVEVKGGLVPTEYRVKLGPEPLLLKPDQLVHFRNHNPDSLIKGLSPMEALRTVLDEDMSSIDHRKDMWKHAGRQPIILKRPKGAPDWGPEASARFNKNFTTAFRSPNGETTPILEDDMDLVMLSFNSEQNQYAESRKLSMEQTAMHLHIPLSIAGISGGSSTFASVREFHKMLYQDTLGPDIDELESDIALQLMPDFADIAGVYIEFNIMEKLQGSFEEQMDVLVKATGRPVMSADEGRARLNLRSKGGTADNLAVPLNIDVKGEEGDDSLDEDVVGTASLADRVNGAGTLIRSGFVPQAALALVGLPSIEHTGLLPVTLKDEPTTEAVAAVANKTLGRQRDVIAKRLASGDGSVTDAWDSGRWDRELANDLEEIGIAQPLIMAQAINAGHRAQLVAALEGRTNGHSV